MTNGLVKRLLARNWNFFCCIPVCLGLLMVSIDCDGQDTQMIKRFDNDPDGNGAFDGLVSMGPPVMDVGSDFSPLEINRNFAPSMISNQMLHVVSKAEFPTQLEGAGRIIFAGPCHSISKVYVGEGDLPSATGTAGLVELSMKEPTPYFFKKGAPLYVYYVMEPGQNEHSFSQLFGDGTRSILTLLVKSKNRISNDRMDFSAAPVVEDPVEVALKAPAAKPKSYSPPKRKAAPKPKPKPRVSKPAPRKTTVKKTSYTSKKRTYNRWSSQRSKWQSRRSSSSSSSSRSRTPAIDRLRRRF